MLELEPVPAFEDNYIWTVHDGRHALLVDPGEAAPILAWLATRRMTPVAVLVSHRHGDHVGGLAGLLARHPGLPVHGPAGLARVDRPAREGDTLVCAELNARFQVMAVPGHTNEHLAFFGHGWLFCGDSLFSCGCGKAFDGHPEQLYASLTRLATLPPDTAVCCAHEYTLENIAFGERIDPDNAALRDWRARAEALRAAGRPTLPVSLASELACNPFLRCHEPGLRAGLARLTGAEGYSDTVDAFLALRRLRDAT